MYCNDLTTIFDLIGIHGEEMYGVRSGGCQAKRLTKENLDRLSGAWIELGGCHGSY